MSEPTELMPLPTFQKEMERLNNKAQHGCGDHSCVIRKPTGMGTNGGCRCSPRVFAEHLLWLASEADKYGKNRQWKK